MIERLFDIPRSERSSTEGARRSYSQRWDRDWPFKDDYLRTLAKEIAVGAPAACDTLLISMREHHEFTPDR